MAYIEINTDGFFEHDGRMYFGRFLDFNDLGEVDMWLENGEPRTVMKSQIIPQDEWPRYRIGEEINVDFSMFVPGLGYEVAVRAPLKIEGILRSDDGEYSYEVRNGLSDDLKVMRETEVAWLDTPEEERPEPKVTFF